MIFFKRCGLVVAAITLSINGWATELNTDEQKLGYIIGMDIGKSLRDQDTAVDIDSLLEAISATYKGEPLAMTADEAEVIRQAYIQKRQADQHAQADAAGAANLAAGQKFLTENKAKDGVRTDRIRTAIQNCDPGRRCHARRYRYGQGTLSGHFTRWHRI